MKDNIDTVCTYCEAFDLVKGICKKRGGSLKCPTYMQATISDELPED